MQLFSMLVFNGRHTCVQQGWRFSNDGTMLVQIPDGSEVLFSKISIEQEASSHLILDGNLCADGKYGVLSLDKKKIKNQGMAILVIVAEGDIVLPERLHYDHRVRIEPVASRSGLFVATVICFLKTEDLIFCIENEFGKKNISFSYDKQLRFPIVEDKGNLQPVYQAKESWWYKMKKISRTAFRRFFLSHNLWRV